MKRHISIAALAALSIIPAFAQRGAGPGFRLDYLAGYLSLTDSQKTDAQAIFDAAHTASQTALGQMTTARDALKQAVKDGKPDATLDQLAAAVGVIEGQLAAIQAKAESKFYALLTTDQKAKYDQLGDRSGPGMRRMPRGAGGQ